MILKLNTGIVGKGVQFLPGDVVDWQNDADCKRMIERGLASKPTAEEIKSASGKVKTYLPPKSRPEEKWPPALKPVPRSYSETE